MNRKRLSAFAFYSVFLVALTACADPGSGAASSQGATSSAVESNNARAAQVEADNEETAKKSSPQTTSATDSSAASTPSSSAASVPPKEALQDPKQAASAEKKRLSKKEQKFIENAEKSLADDSEDEELPAIDPRAVAEGGEATCQRLEFLEKADPTAVPGVLASDELSNAEAAISILCPEFSEDLQLSAAGFADGQFKVGKKQSSGAVAEGTYVARTPGEGCTWTVRDKGGAVISSGGIGNKEDFKMIVEKSAKKVESAGCYAWLPTGGGGNGTSG